MAKLRVGVHGDPVIIRKCHQNRCDWDQQAPVFVDQEPKTSKLVWKLRMMCNRGCGSLKEQQFAPRLPLEEYKSRRKIERPENWYDVSEYFVAALSERLSRGEVQLLDTEGRQLLAPHSPGQAPMLAGTGDKAGDRA